MVFHFNAVDVFKIAVEIEENGRRFYEEALKIVDDPGVQRLFQELALQEVEHKARFEQLMSQFSTQVTSPPLWDPDSSLDQYIKMMADMHVFVAEPGLEQQMKGVRDVPSALRLAIQFEKDSIILFLSLQEATEGKKEAQLVDLLVKEEREHLKRLSLELRRISY